MYWKDEFARMILTKQLKSYTDFAAAMSSFPSLRVKTIDAQGRIVVVQLSEKGEWIKPLEWANNHVASLRARYQDSRTRLEAVGGDPTADCQATCQTVQKLAEDIESNKGEIQMLREKLQLANHNYLRAMQMAMHAYRRMDLSPNERQALGAWDVDHPTYCFKV